MERPLQKGHIAEQLHQARGAWIFLDAAAVLGQNHKRKIRPRRLILDPFRERARIGVVNRLFGHDRRICVPVQLLHQFGDVDADVGTKRRVS